jgi:dienelactone hydrolase
MNAFRVGWIIVVLTVGSFANGSHADDRAQHRQALREMLGIPALGGPLNAEPRGAIEHDAVVIEKWIYTAEAGSKIPALFYRPKVPAGKLPVVVFTYGHGSSKSAWTYHYAAQVYAKLGLATLAIDPIGEEERHLDGRLGSRAHDNKEADRRAASAGRLMMGKLVFDTMRGIDLLATREDVDMARIAVAGYSLGGAKASWMAALDPRLRAALVCGWAYDDIILPTKLCTSVPFTNLRKSMDWPTFIGLAAPHCALLTANGDSDSVIDRNDRAVWQRSAAHLEAARKHWGEQGDAMLANYLERGGGHRPYFVYREALLFLDRHLDLPGATPESIQALPTVNAGAWCDRYQIQLEKLYGTELHWRGASLPDLNIRPLPPEALAVLQPAEKGLPVFTLEGWLERIDPRADKD